MAAPFFLYGSSPDALAQQQQNYERLFTSAAEGNRAAAHAAQQASIANAMQARAQDDALRLSDARNRMSLFFSNQERADAARREAENQRRYETGLALQLGERNRQQAVDRQFTFPKMQAEVDYTKQQVQNAKTYNPVALKMLEFSHNRAAEDAANGNINSVEDALKLYKGITRDDAVNYYQQSLQARSEIESSLGEIEGAAKTMTDYEQAKRKLTEASAKKPSGDWYRWGTPSADAITTERAQAQSIVDALEPTVKALQDPRAGIVSRLKFDAEAGTYTPMLPKLPWLKKGNTETASTAAVSQPQTATYTSPDEVKAAVKSGVISREDGIKLLRSQFGFE